MRERIDLFVQIWARPWVRWAGAIVTSLGLYDLFVAQAVPPDVQDTFPRAYEIIKQTSGWLPLSAWLTIIFTILVSALVEQIVRNQRKSADEIAAVKLALNKALVVGKERPKLASLPLQKTLQSILIEPTGVNRFDIKLIFLNQNDEPIFCVGDVIATINGEVVSRTRPERSIVPARHELTVTLSVHNVKIEPVNAMVSALNVEIRYLLDYGFLDFPNAEPRSTGKKIDFRAPIHMTGVSAISEILPNYTEDIER